MPQSIRATTAARAVVFAPIAPGGRAELVARRLSDAIDLGLLSHGEKLPSEATMATRFGVATVTAREALEALRAQGLVETRRGRGGGSFVTAPESRAIRIQRRIAALSRVDVRDMGVYYGAIAGTAAELAAERATVDDILRLRGLIDGADADSESSTRRAEGTLRLEVAALAQSARLVREEMRVQAEFAPLLWWRLRDPAERRANTRANRAIVEAIEAVDPTAARARTIAHIGAAIEWLLDAKTDLDRRR